MPLSLDNVGKGFMFVGCIPVVPFIHPAFVQLFIYPFVKSDTVIVAMICHERLEQF